MAATAAPSDVVFHGDEEKVQMPFRSSTEEEKRDVGSDSQVSEKASVVDAAPIAPIPAAPEHEWVTGMKLATIMIAGTLVTFLMMLDTSIIVTVRFQR